MIEFLTRQPFEPLDVFLNDGSVVRVRSPHLIATGKNRATFTLYSDEDDEAQYIAYRNIVKVVTNEPTGASG